jgi:SAM-dependent methyltransferase
MILEHTLPVIDAAERAAVSGKQFNDLLPTLRRLSLDEFGELMISMPMAAYPALSAVMPAMTPADVQHRWTGSSGFGLYPQTSQFVRTLQSLCLTPNEKGLGGKTILDFGCGYGRLVRMMYYYTSPEKIWGVDPWHTSLDECKKANLVGNFVQSQELPERLPTGSVEFEFGFSFSVFTHLTKEASLTALNAIRQSMAPGAMFVLTIRPVEFWPYLEAKKNRPEITEAENAHRAAGYGFLPVANGSSLIFGDSSFELNLFNNISGWDMVAYDTLLFDPYQIVVALRRT